MEMSRRLLTPETYRRLPERDQSPVPTSFEWWLFAKCMAFADADHWADYYTRTGNYPAAIQAAETCERFRTQLKPLLEELVIQ